MKLKKILAAVSAAAVMSSGTIFNVSADSEDLIQKQHVMGCITSTPEKINEFCGDAVSFAQTRATLSSSVDLSDDPCFPEIADQGGLGSCTAFATTYYQYSYEVNKLNGVNSSANRVIYSPKWTYNLSNNSVDLGSEIIDNYAVLMDFGALKNEDFAYTGYQSDYTEIPDYMVEEKIEALSTRVYDVDLYEIPNSSSITSPSSLALVNIKYALSQGKVLVSETECDFDSEYINGRCIVYRCSDKTPGTHAVAIVGYDDNISYDVNGNGVIENCEKGAFKVANSWGLEYDDYGISSVEGDEDAGYFWVLYDALNRVSANTTNNWESGLDQERYPAFATDNSPSKTSKFYSIDVAHKDVKLIGELDINTTDREGLSVKINRTADNITSWQSANAITIANLTKGYVYNDDGDVLNKNVPYDGYLLFDYSSFADSVSEYISGYNWQACVEVLQTGSTVASLRIIDNKAQALTSFSHLSGGSTLSAYCNISYLRGDVNYSGALDANDSIVLMNYVSMNATFSDFQIELADYNNDNVVNVNDVLELNSALMSTASVSEQKIINEVNARAYEYIKIYGVGGNISEIY